MHPQNRHSMQLKNSVGLLLLAAAPLLGILLLSAPFTLFFVAVAAVALCALFAVGFVLLFMKLRSKPDQNQVLARQ